MKGYKKIVIILLAIIMLTAGIITLATNSSSLNFSKDIKDLKASAISTSERLIKDFILICKDNGCKVYDKSLDNYLTEGKGYTSVINLSILSK